MKEVSKSEEIFKNQSGFELTLENRLEIIDEGIRKKYLSRLYEMPIAPINSLKPLEEDLISNVRLFKITEMVYQKGEAVTEKFTTVFNTLSTYDASTFILIDSDGIKTDFFLGVRNNMDDDSPSKRSTVTLGDTLKNTLIGHFPGVKIRNEDRGAISDLSNKIINQKNVASVSVVGNPKQGKNQQDGQGTDFVQGLEKLTLSLKGRKYTGIILAQSQSPQNIEIMRKNYQELYTKLSPWQKIQINNNESYTTSRNQSFSEMSGIQKSALIGQASIGLIGSLGFGIAGATVAGAAGAQVGAMVGGQLLAPFGSFINYLAPIENISNSKSTSKTSTTENKVVADMLHLLDESLKRMNEFDSYGQWNVAGYFLSDDMTTAEIAASNYRSLMNGEHSGREVSAINSWRANNKDSLGNYFDLTTYLSRFVHPQFIYGGNVLVNPATSVSGKELGLHLGLPRASVPGLPVIEHAEFGKEVNSYRLFSSKQSNDPKDKITLGKVFDLGQITDKLVELDNRSLNMHTFITGSTGSGKSNTVYQILTELHQDEVPFLVIEPAKGEYKDVFGNWKDVNVFSTNPNIAPLININPFMFPDAIHVLEHIDGLVEIFSVCWPMYDAMPAFFKNAILKAYEYVGWDLGSSTFIGEIKSYPDFEIIAEQLEKMIDETDYSAEVKGNYTGALLTRVKSLSIGLNRYIFSNNQTPYEKLFDENCILDISRIKSIETKALIMGLVVYLLNEYRIDKKTKSNTGLKHVTVLEEAHNLLKNTKGDNSSELVSKSVEILTNTIAEIRTYGEGFIIVDQSPSSVDISAIKNTNTKIILRTPEENDRKAVGGSIGLTNEQVNEIAKLPSGVAVVYQNDWINPVLTMVDKAPVEEKPYENKIEFQLKSINQSRTEVISAIMEPWLNRERVEKNDLLTALKSLEVSRPHRQLLLLMIDTYNINNGHITWHEDSLPLLKEILLEILSITENEMANIITTNQPDILRKLITRKTNGFTLEQIEEICFIITMEE